MSAELPLISAIMARLSFPDISMAAYNAIVFPLALLIESPIIMLLAASTALSKDWASYQKIRRYMMVAGLSLTALHLLVALTPLYYLIVEGLLGAPQALVEPARLGFLIMTPWTWSIAYRRFNQGVLIRFGHSNKVGLGTLTRLGADCLVLAIGYFIASQPGSSLPGIVVGTAAVASGVMAEALYTSIVVRPVLNREVKPAPPVTPALTYRAFFDFYLPLVLTAMLGLLVQPIGSAAINRMPNPIASQAAWGVVSGLIFMLRSLGMAYNEVVVALLDEPRSSPSLRRFAYGLASAVTCLLFLVALTPLSDLWFKTLSGLSPALAALAQSGLWLGIFLPALAVFQSWFQGLILHGRRTRGITESIFIFLGVNGLILGTGVAWGQIPGLYVGMASYALSALTQVTWLWRRSRKVYQEVHERDVPAVSALPAQQPTQ